MGILRTCEKRFKNLPNFHYEPNYVEVGEPQMAYIEEGRGEETFLCLHGEPTWSFLYRKMIPILKEKGKVIVPDFVGFGRSDKYEDKEAYTYTKYYTWLESFVEKIELTNITLICQDWGGLLGLPVALNNPERFARLVPMNTGLVDGNVEMADEWWKFRNFVAESDDLPIGDLIDYGTEQTVSEEVKAGYEAPFPNSSHKAAAHVWPLMVPTDPEMDGAETMGDAIGKLANWEKPAFVLFGDSDPITSRVRDSIRNLIPTASEQPDIWIEDAGHFLQEDKGEEIANHIVRFVNRTPLEK